jgi:type II secretory pathway predicted ATPase ExeA
MSEIVLRLGDLDPSQHAVEELELPVLTDTKSVAECKKAVDSAAAWRSGVVVMGPKGAGKTVGLEQAEIWFCDLERKKQALDAAYRPRRVLRVTTLREMDYRASAVHLAETLSPRYSDRYRGRKKTDADVKKDLVTNLVKLNYAVLIVDELERGTDDTLVLLRDLITDCNAEAPERYTSSNAKKSAGLGVVIAGTPEERLVRMEEAGERWSAQYLVPQVDHVLATRVYLTWFPGFQAHVEAVGSEYWSNYLRTLLWQAQPPSFRLIENHAKAYAWLTLRSARAPTHASDIHFNRDVFEKALNDARWAQNQRPNVGTK